MAARYLQLDWCYRLLLRWRRTNVRWGVGRAGQLLTPSRPSADNHSLQDGEFPEEPTPEMIAEWHAILEYLASNLSHDVVLLFAPALNIDGKIATAADALWPQFEQLCDQYEIVCRDLEREFQDHLFETGRHPFGFINRHPYRGHLNGGGNRVIATTLARIILGRDTVKPTSVRRPVAPP